LASLIALLDLGLTNTQISGLSPLAGLTALNGIRLDGTQVFDLSPIVGFEQLRVLTLNNVPATDLRPLSNLASLNRESSGFLSLVGQLLLETGLHFKKSGATRLDPELKRLSEIEDDTDRTTQTLDYLSTLTEWPPTPPDAPDQDALFRVIIDENGAEVAAALPDAEEQADRVRLVCLEELRGAVTAFFRIADNYHPQLGKRARVLGKLLETDLPDLDLLRVHMNVEGLRRIYDKRAEREGEERLSADEVDALSDVIAVAPRLTLENEEVERYEARNAERSAGPDSAEVIASHQQMLEAIQQQTEIMGEGLRDIARLAAEAPPNTNGVRIGGVLISNTVLAVGAFAVAGASNAVIGDVAVKGAQFLWMYSEPLRIIMAAKGPAYLAWFTPIAEHMGLMLTSVQGAPPAPPIALQKPDEERVAQRMAP
jgi:hypothetical protein